MRRVFPPLLLILVFASLAFAGDLTGRVTDRSGGALPGATVKLLNVATGEEQTATADAAGRYRFPSLKIGVYRVAATAQGFAEGSKTVIVEDESKALTADLTLEIGPLSAGEVVVSADRGERDVKTIPLRVDTLQAETLRALTATSVGDAMIAAPGITPVGNGPFQVRPRLRGLDSTRVLILLDGERLNNARTATDRAGIEVGLVDMDSIESIEVLGGAGSVLYGTDALSGTINILTNHPQFTPARRVTAGGDVYYSSNELGRRGTVTLGLSDKKWAVSFNGGGEKFDNYHAGADYGESSAPFFTSGQIKQTDTIDTNFGFNFKKFPEAFNTPFTRTGDEVALSGMTGNSTNVAGIAMLSPRQTIEAKYQRRRATNIGFPDFQQPIFFQTITLPYSQLDKTSVKYSLTSYRPWLPKVTVSSYFQRQDRLLHNEVPVQFPVPTATVFLPINVYRLAILSDTRQQVWTPGLEAQATILPRASNVLTVGMTFFRDRSEDERTTNTSTFAIGQVTAGQTGLAATVFPTPIPQGPAVIAHPSRVPDATFRDFALFAHDEWDATPALRLTGGLRFDGYHVVTKLTTGYSLADLVNGATPPIDPRTLLDVGGDEIARKSMTGEVGAVLWSSHPTSFFGHYVHSYRHPNLEELLFAGPATTGSIVPNVRVKPETGDNIDLGVRLRRSQVSATVSYFHNFYNNFISTEVISSSPAAGSISQAINLAKVRIQGLESQISAPFVAKGLIWSPTADMAYNHGTVVEGTSPLSGLNLDGQPQDNITPWKISIGLRASDRREKWWAGYSVRTETEVNRVSPLLLDSPFLIAQDLLGLAGFSVHRIAGGYDWRSGDQRIGLTLSLDNLANRFYREQYQFAPARGRSFSLQLHIRGVK